MAAAIDEVVATIGVAATVRVAAVVGAAANETAVKGVKRPRVDADQNADQDADQDADQNAPATKRRKKVPEALLNWGLRDVPARTGGHYTYTDAAAAALENKHSIAFTANENQPARLWYRDKLRTVRDAVAVALDHPPAAVTGVIGTVPATDERVSLRGQLCLRASRDLREHELVGIYGGLVAFEDEVLDVCGMRLELEFSRYAADLGTAVRDGSRTRHLVVSALGTHGNATRYINDAAADPYAASDTSRGNCEFGRTGDGPTCFVYTTRAVRAGEEITARYGAEYWDALAQHERRRAHIATENAKVVAALA